MEGGRDGCGSSPVFDRIFDLPPTFSLPVPLVSLTGTGVGDGEGDVQGRDSDRTPFLHGNLVKVLKLLVKQTLCPHSSFLYPGWTQKSSISFVPKEGIMSNFPDTPCFYFIEKLSGFETNKTTDRVIYTRF